MSINNLIQVGGHQLIKKVDNSVYKPTRKREAEFYKYHLPKECPELIPFLPKCISVGSVATIKNLYSKTVYQNFVGRGYTHYIQLENLIENISDIDLNNSVILDLKLGSIDWLSSDPSDTVKKVLEKNHKSIMSKHKFRLDGASVKDIIYSKEECREMSIDKVQNIINCTSKSAKIKIIKWINELLIVLANVKTSFYGVSLFIIDSSGKDGNGQLIAKLIDFAKYERSEINCRHDDIIPALMSIRSLLFNN